MMPKLEELFEKFDIFVEQTPYIKGKRGLEIKHWLASNENVDKYVILDDEIFESFDEELMKNFIKISNGNGMNFGEGLLKKDAEVIINRLGRIRKKEDDYER